MFYKLLLISAQAKHAILRPDTCIVSSRHHTLVSMKSTSTSQFNCISTQDTNAIRPSIMRIVLVSLDHFRPHGVLSTTISVRGVRPYDPSYMGTNIRGGDRDKGCDFLLRNLIGGGVEEGEIDDVLRRRILASWHSVRRSTDGEFRHCPCIFYHALP